MTHIWGPVLGLLANAMVFGLSWWPFQAMQARGLHPLWATAFMYGGKGADMGAAFGSGSSGCWSPGRFGSHCTETVAVFVSVPVADEATVAVTV